MLIRILTKEVGETMKKLILIIVVLAFVSLPSYGLLFNIPDFENLEKPVASELLGTPQGKAETAQTLNTMSDESNVGQTQKQVEPLITFSQMDDGKDLREYGGSTAFASPPDLKIVNDPEKGNVLEFKYAMAPPSAVWFKAGIDKVLNPEKDKIKFSIKGLEEKPESIVVRLIKKDESFSEIVIGDKDKLADLGYKGEHIELSISNSRQDIEIPVKMFVRKGGDIIWGNWLFRKRIKKFASENDISNVVAIEIVVRTDLNRNHHGGFRITDIFNLTE
jgi:hypothetical protein